MYVCSRRDFSAEINFNLLVVLVQLRFFKSFVIVFHYTFLFPLYHWL